MLQAQDRRSFIYTLRARTRSVALPAIETRPPTGVAPTLHFLDFDWGASVDLFQ